MSLSKNLSEKEKNRMIAVALRKLSRKMRTEKEIRRLLSEEGSTKKLEDEIIEFLIENQFLDDRKYAKEYYLVHKPKGKADRQILRELEQKGIGESLAKSAIMEFKENESYDGNEGLFSKTEASFFIHSEEKNALRIARKMAEEQLEKGSPLDEKFLAKVGRKLFSLGYDGPFCYRAIDDLRDRRQNNGREEDEG